ncbi:hypothetical protein D9M70_618510 [compost metagenome]
MLMESRGAHVRATGQYLDVQRLGEVRMQMAQGRGNPGELALLLHQRPQHIGLGPAQRDEQQLPQPRLAHDLAFQWVVQATQQAFDTPTHGVIEHCAGH